MVLSNMASLEFGADFACGARADSTRICWGDDTYGELGDGMMTGAEATPTAYPEPVSAVTVRSAHACALTPDQAVQCWGYNNTDQCGLPVGTTPYVETLNPVSGDGSALAGCTNVATGAGFTCAICADQPWCWGDNLGLELGRGEAPPPGVPKDSMADRVQVPAGTYTQVSAGQYYACAVDAAGELYCWGFGGHGELGDGSHAANLPTLIGIAQ